MFERRSKERKVLRNAVLLFRTGLELKNATWTQDGWNLYRRFEKVRQQLGKYVRR